MALEPQQAHTVLVEQTDLDAETIIARAAEQANANAAADV